MPGYELQSAEGEFPSELLCSECRLLMRDPVQTVDGVRMCSSCLSTHLFKFTRFLKTQGEVSAQWFPDKAVQKQIMEWRVKCKHVSKRCYWQGKFKDLESHCKHQCLYESSVVSPNQTEECIRVVQVELQTLVRDLKIIQGVVQGLQNRFLAVESKLQKLEEQIHVIIAKQRELLSQYHRPVQDYDLHSEGLATFHVTATPQQAQVYMAHTSVTVLMHTVNHMQCGNGGAMDRTREGGSQVSTWIRHTKITLFLHLQLLARDIEDTIMETRGIMQENGAMIKEGNEDIAQFMTGASGALKNISPMRRK